MRKALLWLLLLVPMWVSAQGADVGAEVKQLQQDYRAAQNKFFKETLSKGEQPKPVMMEINGKMVGHYAIITNKMCLQCHGTINKEILPQTYSRINTLYPDDKATGYAENQVRGLWVIEMEKNMK